ncbi:MAG: hypothetical protein WCJ07_10745, partial [Verrucomicrobiota bacterium]
DVLLAAMKDKILASAELSVVYTRSGSSDDRNPGAGTSRNRPDGSGADGQPEKRRPTPGQ